jgi:hypothetical protein
MIAAKLRMSWSCDRRPFGSLIMGTEKKKRPESTTVQQTVVPKDFEERSASNCNFPLYLREAMGFCSFHLFLLVHQSIDCDEYLTRLTFLMFH